MERVGGRVVVLGALSSSKAGDTEVVFMARRVRAGDSDLESDASQVSNLISDRFMQIFDEVVILLM